MALAVHSRRPGHPARPDDRRARARRRDHRFGPFRAGSDPAGEPRSAPGRHGLSGARELSARPRTPVAERIDELKLHEISLRDGAVLETGCVYIVPLIESLALPSQHRGLSQSEKFDREARRLHPRHRRQHARLRPDRAPATTARFTLRSARGRFQCWCATDRGCRKSGFGTAHAHARRRGARRIACAERLVDDDDADLSDGIAVGVDLAGFGPQLVGYRAKHHTGLIDVDRRAGYECAEFWEPIARPRRQS